MPNKKNPDRQYAILTRKDREFLLAGGRGYDRHDKSERKASVVPRTRHALTDFWLLTDGLPGEWWSEIFDASPPSEEYLDLEGDVSAAIEFLYTGLGGERAFRHPLKRGVARAEVALGNVENTLEVEPHFALDAYQKSDIRDVVDTVEAQDWDRLRKPDLFRFIRLAAKIDAIAFDQIHEHLDPPIRDEFSLSTDSSQPKWVRVSSDTLERLEEIEDVDGTLDDAINGVLDRIEKE